jgi:hypothetical protein
MNNALLDECNEAIANLPQNGDSFLRRDLIVFFDVMLEV